MSDTPPAATPAPAPLPRGERVRTAATVLIAVAVVFAGLYYGAEVFIPICLALVFTALLRPVVRVLEKVRVPTWLAATLVVLATIAMLVGAGIAVAAPVRSWSSEAPESLKKAEQKLRGLVGSAGVSAVLGESDAGTSPTSGAAAGQEGAPAQGGADQEGQTPRSVRPKPAPAVSRVTSRALGSSLGLLTGLLEVLLLTWFLLASGDLFLRKLVNVLPHITEKKRALDVVHETESVVSRYMVVTLLINLGQGAAVGLAMWLIGMPAPVLWGMLTVLLEFIPYLGGLTLVILLSLMGLATFDSAGHALLAPGAYLLISTLQNNLVSPFAYGSRLKLNPVAVLIGVMIWYALWGVPGAFLAVPIVATAKVMADRIPGLDALGEFLGR